MVDIVGDNVSFFCEGVGLTLFSMELLKLSSILFLVTTRIAGFWRNFELVLLL